jgi:LPS sulfotransferase NodH
MAGSETKGRRVVYDLAQPSADFREWNDRPQRTFLICTQMRSGSTLLGEAIYFAGGLGCPVEYFHRGFRTGFERRWATSDIRAYAKMVHRYRTDPSGVFSVKLFWGDLLELVCEVAPGEFSSLDGVNASRIDASVYRRIFSTIADIFPCPTFILLTRRDEIRQAVSTFVATETRLWRRFSTRTGAPRADYNFDGIVQRLAEIQNDNHHWLNFFRGNGLQYYGMTYEDLADNYEVTLRRFFAALGRPDAPITPPRLQKQADVYSEELLERFLIEFHQRAHGA